MKFKDELTELRFKFLAPMAQRLAVEMDEWSVKHHQKELTLTATVSTIKEDKLLGRVSDTHRSCRAFDVRVSDLTEDHIAQLCGFFRKKYPRLGAVGASGTGGNAGNNLIVFRPHGTGPHLHIQLNRTYSQISKELPHGTP